MLEQPPPEPAQPQPPGLAPWVQLGQTLQQAQYPLQALSPPARREPEEPASA
jgi:hypothetical protein